MTRRLTITAALLAVLALLSISTATDAYACKSCKACKAKAAAEAEKEAATKHNVAPEGFTALFNGKDVDNWVVKSGVCTYEVKDGIITGTTVKGSGNTFLTTPNEYGDFELMFDVLLHDNQLNSGVQIRSKVVKENKHGGRIGGPQVEIEAGPGQSGFIYGEFTERKWMSPDANKRAHDHFKNGEWNTYRIVAKGNNVKTFINGQATEDLDLPEAYYDRFKQGVVGLQVHSVRGDPKWQVSWRNIYIKELSE